MDLRDPKQLILTGPQDLRTRSLKLLLDAAALGGAGALRLGRNDQPRLAATGAAAAADLLAGQRPVLCDASRALAWIDAAGSALLTGPRVDDAAGEPVRASDPDGAGAGAEQLELAPVAAPPGTAFVDLAMRDRRIALAWTNGSAGAAGDHGVAIVELGSKRHDRLPLDAAPRRVWIDARQRIWVLTADALLCCEGSPLPQPWRPDPAGFKPAVANPNAPGVRQRLPLPFAAGVAALCDDGERLYLLAGDRLHTLDLAAPLTTLTSYPLDPALPAVSDCRAVAGGRLALWVPVALDGSQPLLDCPILQLDVGGGAGGGGGSDAGTGGARLLAERWPRRAPVHNGFVANPEAAALYLSGAGAESANRQRVLALVPLPQARYHRIATAVLTERLDGGAAGTCWDRLRLDACIPDGTAVRVLLRAFDDPDRRADYDWHDQGAPVPVPAAAADLDPPAADPAGAGLRQWDWVIRREPGTGPVRELRGRWLQIKLQLAGNGLATPRVSALRAWAPRRSWQRAYLPEFMHQGDVVEEGAAGLANGADVRERMFAALNAIVDPIAARIAGAERLIDPMSAPATLLPQLAHMLGERPPAHWPEARRRAWLALSGDLQRWRGTFKGLCLALDLATDGAVSRGQVVPLEDWRLRRPLFTALGVDFAAAAHPLTLGTVQSGNSIVGDTLTLGPDDARVLLLALLPDADPDASTLDLLRRYADGQAYRLSIVVHASANALRGSIDELLAAELPVHLAWQVLETEHGFVPGLAPLLGIHTFLETFPAWRRMVLDRERIGGAAVLANEPLLTPGRRLVPVTGGDPR